MRYVVTLVLLVSMVMLPGCGAVFVAGVTSFSTTATGTVSIVRLTATNDGVQFTFVTLVQTTGAQDFNFCGNVVNQFPINTTVQASFSPGTPCNSVVHVVIVV